MTREAPVAGSPTPSRPEPRPGLDRAISELQEHKQAWVEQSLERKIAYLSGIQERTLRVAEGQVAAALEAKGLPPDSPLAAEDWLGGPYITLRVVRLLIESLEQLREHGQVLVDPTQVRQRRDGQVAVRVFPASLYDRLLYGGFRAEVWMQPGVTAANLSRHMGGVYKRSKPRGKVSLVLGAGNVASIGPLDAIHKLFYEGHTVLLKFHPVNDYLGPFVEDAFRDLIADGFVRTAFGGADVGDYLCHHPGIEEIHITGSDRTHDLIVFGPGEEGRRRKAENRPRLQKPITSELGNVSPMIVVPGDWSESDLRFQAENLASQMTQNAGFNCNATKVIVTHRDWPQRKRLLERLREVLRELPERPAYYPGAEERYRSVLEAHPDAERLGQRRDGVIPPTLLPGLDPDREDDVAFISESFCAVTAETSLPGADAADFLRQAVEFCNHTLRGTLNAGVILHPRTERELGGRLEEALAALRYGTVAVNHWPAMGYALGSTPWGAYPGHTLDDIQSGIGVVHNALLFDRPQKSVVTGPFRVFPKPVWFTTHGGGHLVGPGLCRLEADPSLRHLPGIVLAALRG